MLNLEPSFIWALVKSDHNTHIIYKSMDLSGRSNSVNQNNHFLDCWRKEYVLNLQKNIYVNEIYS